MSDTAAFVMRSFSCQSLLPSVPSILQILSAPPGFQRIFGFPEVSTGQGLLSHAGEYLCPAAFLLYIAFLYSVVKVPLSSFVRSVRLSFCHSRFQFLFSRCTTLSLHEKKQSMESCQNCISAKFTLSELYFCNFSV